MSKITFDPNKHSQVDILSTDGTRVIAQLKREKDSTDAEWAFLLQDIANIQVPDEPEVKE